jgi:hypothetical protein
MDLVSNGASGREKSNELVGTNTGIVSAKDLVFSDGRSMRNSKMSYMKKYLSLIVPI